MSINSNSPDPNAMYTLAIQLVNELLSVKNRAGVFILGGMIFLIIIGLVILGVIDPTQRGAIINWLGGALVALAGGVSVVSVSHTRSASDVTKAIINSDKIPATPALPPLKENATNGQA